MPYRWSQAAQRYRAPNGRFVKGEEVRRDLERIRRGVADEMLALTEGLRGKSMTLVEWRLAMRDLIRGVHTLHGAVAAGGLRQISASDLGRIGAEVKRQYSYLDRFVAQIEAGAPVDGRAARRAAMYAAAALGTFSRVESVKHREAGYTEARRVLGIAEHCADCVAWAGQWLPIEAVPPIGASQCRVNCKCHIIYRRA